MKKIKILAYVLSGILLFSGVAHLVFPDFYEILIPEFIPALLANILAAIVEIGIGIALLLPKYRGYGGLGFALLMIAFLPLHVWDLFRENPALGEQPVPTIRLIMQFVLIYLGWLIYARCKAENLGK